MRAGRSVGVVGAALLAGAVALAISPTVGAATAAGGSERVDFGLEGPGEGEPQQQPVSAGAAGLELTLDYRTVIAGLAGIDDPDLADLMAQSSQLKALERRPPATHTGLMRRAEADVERLGRVLRSLGYYDGDVSFAVDDAVTPAVVTVTIVSGERYRLAAYEVRFVGPVPHDVALDPELAIGIPAEAKPIADAQTRLIETLRDRGRPFAKVDDRVATIDRAAKTMSVVLTIDAGPTASFGPVTIEGLDTLDPAFVRGKIPWREGDRYARSKVDALRTTLLGLGLFNTVKIDVAEAVRTDGSLPVAIVLTEAPARSIGAGAAFSTSEGFLLDVFWEHRNLLGAAESLRLSGSAGTLSQRAEANFRKPDFRRADQDLLARGAVLRSNNDAFDETTISSFLGLERRLSQRWRVSGGGSFELSRITDQQSGETVQLFGVPLKATRDNRDDLLNPTRGSVLGFELTPYTGHAGETLTFALARLSAMGYVAFDERRRIVLAGRTRLATLAGEQRAAIPANKRLYSGGGGSVRGYEFQKVGPLDGEHDPLGGRSQFELGAELRLRVTKEIGIVPFVEAGNVWEDRVPDVTGHLQWAAGLGLRYYTAIGPARVDFAVPLNRRPNIDDRFQVYFSLGQAF